MLEGSRSAPCPHPLAFGLITFALIGGLWATDAAPATVAGSAAKERTQILCVDGSGSEYRRKQEPRQCAIFNDGITAGGVNLKRLNWNNWGSERARANGVECSFHLPCQDIPAKVKAYRRRERCGHLVYTRIKVRTEFGKATPRPAGCPGSTF